MDSQNKCNRYNRLHLFILPKELAELMERLTKKLYNWKESLDYCGEVAMLEKSLQTMQEEIDTYIGQFKVGYFSPLGQMARLTEEVGELAREVNHHYGEKQKKSTESTKEIREELGDVLFVVLSMANSLEIDMTEAFDQVMEKFNQRDKFRFERNDEKHD